MTISLANLTSQWYPEGPSLAAQAAPGACANQFAFSEIGVSLALALLAKDRTADWQHSCGELSDCLRSLSSPPSPSRKQGGNPL